MKLENMTKHEAKKQVVDIFERIAKKAQLSDLESYFLAQIEFHVEKDVIGKIRERQNSIPGLHVEQMGKVAMWGGEKLTPGCDNCIHGHGLCAIRMASKCNLDCPFCYFRGEYDKQAPLMQEHLGLLGQRRITEDDLKSLFDKQGDKITHVCHVLLEPFMEFEKFPNVVRLLHEQGVHQHMYTNGTLVTEEHLKILRDAGLEELRFNLAATNCSRRVVKTMKMARKYVKYLAIESPMFKTYYESFIANRSEILDTGVDQINCAELHLKKQNFREYKDEPLYCYKSGYISPVSSRQLTYDLIDRASCEEWENVVIHDCSNEVKLYRGMVRDAQFGTIKYHSEMQLPMRWYLEVFDRYDFWDSVFISSTTPETHKVDLDLPAAFPSNVKLVKGINNSSPRWYLSMNDKIEYDLEDQIWINVLQRIDGSHSIQEILDELKQEKTSIMEHIEHYWENGLIDLIDDHIYVHTALQKKVLKLNLPVSLASNVVLLEEVGSKPAYSLCIDDKIRFELPDERWVNVLLRIDGKRSILDIVHEIGVPLAAMQVYLKTCLQEGILVQHEA